MISCFPFQKYGQLLLCAILDKYGGKGLQHLSKQVFAGCLFPFQGSKSHLEASDGPDTLGACNYVQATMLSSSQDKLIQSLCKKVPETPVRQCGCPPACKVKEGN